MPRKLLINKIELTWDGFVLIQYCKFSSDGDNIGFHRTALDIINNNTRQQLEAIDAHMKRDGFEYDCEFDIQRIETICATVWDEKNLPPETIQAIKTRKQKQDEEFAKLAALHADTILSEAVNEPAALETQPVEGSA